MDADAADLERLLQRRAQPQPGRARRGLVARHQHDRELVAAEPGERVLFAQQRAQARADLAQHLVARVVAERVVELLEAVEVDEQQRQLLVRLGARGHGGVEPVHEVSAVAEPGQIVGLRLVTALAQALDDGDPRARHSGQHGDDRERDGDVGELGELPDGEQRERDRREREDRREDHRAELGSGLAPGAGKPCGGADEDAARAGGSSPAPSAARPASVTMIGTPARQRDRAITPATPATATAGRPLRPAPRPAPPWRRRPCGVQPREPGHVRVRGKHEQDGARGHEHAGRERGAVISGVEQLRCGRAGQAGGRQQPREAPAAEDDGRRGAGNGSRDEHKARGQVEEHRGEMLP